MFSNKLIFSDNLDSHDRYQLKKYLFFKKKGYTLHHMMNDLYFMTNGSHKTYINLNRRIIDSINSMALPQVVSNI